MDMLNDIVLTYTWGGKYSRKRSFKHVPVKSKEEVEIHINYMIKRRNKRGYHLIVPPTQQLKQIEIQ